MSTEPRKAGLVRSTLAVGVSLVALAGLGSPVVADSDGAISDVCLEAIADSLPADAWPLVLESVDEAVAERPDLFPGAFWSVAVGTSTERIDVQAMAPTDLDPDLAAAGPCLAAGSEWTVRVGREFLDLGADRMLALAPTTPGIGSSVEVAWYPDEGRVVTTLSFAGPLDIPNGTCWIDDTLAIDDSARAAVSIVEQGVKTSLFAEGACGRFFDFLANGGAGEQAITLMPTSVELGDGSTLHFVAEDVLVREDGVMISGVVEVR